jgi:DNA-binding MarR family transcriptional regulator
MVSQSIKRPDPPLGSSATALIDALEAIVFGAVGLTTQTLEAATPELELTFTQWRVLIVVGEHPQGIRVSALAARVGTSVPSMSRLVRRLDLRGLLSTERGADDRRSTLVRLTTDGAAVREAILAQRRRRLTALLADIAAPRLEGAEEVLPAVAAAFAPYR